MQVFFIFYYNFCIIICFNSQQCRNQVAQSGGLWKGCRWQIDKNHHTLRDSEYGWHCK